MVDKVADYMRQWHMVEPGCSVIAGVSGGADSICLCCILAELAQQMRFTLRVVHVEHGIRGEDSLRDAQFVEKFCKEHEIECVTYPVDVPAYAKQYHVGEEEAARKLRYEAFGKEAANLPESRIALAHHMEDNAETILFQLARGSGIDGMCGIRPVRCDEDGMIYIRPFLCVSRAEIEAELRQREQEYCTDATNSDVTYSRNRIRNRILPELNQINEQSVGHLNQIAERMSEIRTYLDEQLQKVTPQIVTEAEDSVVIQMNPLMELPHILRTRLVHNALAKAAGARQDITAGHIEAVLELADKQSGKRVNLPYHLIAERSYDTIRIGKAAEIQMGDVTEIVVSESVLAQLAEDGCPMSVPIHGEKDWFTMRIFPFEGNLSEIPRKMYTKWFDYDKIKFGFSIRTRRNQDYFVMDARGHRKKLADYFINEKIPAGRRDKVLLVARESEVLWIVGGRMGCGAQVDGTSRMILELIYEGGTRDGL